MAGPLSIAGCRRGAALLFIVMAAACDDKPPPRARAPDAGISVRSQPRPPAPAPSAGTAEHATEGAASSTRPTTRERGADETAWVFDRAVDVGPAGPATASEHGVVFVTSSDEIALAALSQARRDDLPRTAPAPLKPIAKDTQFRHTTRPPLVLGRSAYWTSGGRMLRRSLDAGAPLEVLRTDARAGTKLSGVLVEKTPYLVYLTQSASGDPRARLWAEGRALLDLSPEGSSASSIRLLRQRSGQLLFLALEGRSAMSPLHARGIRLHDGRPELEADRVLWVGGAAQSSTELDAVQDEHANTWALVPLERSATEFGLASIPVSEEAIADDAVSWTAYANGLPRPALATGRLCGRTAVLTARPAAREPGARQKLHLSTLEGGKVIDRAVVLEAGAIRDVSLATWEGGGLIALVGDGRTQAVTVRCARVGRQF